MSSVLAIRESADQLQSGSAVTRERIEDFLFFEARLLDERRFEEWNRLFSADGVYWVPSNPEQVDPFAQVSIFYDDAELRENRIRRLRHPEIHVQSPPSRTVRTVSNVRFWQNERSEQWQVESVLFVLEYRKGQQRTFGGLVKHVLNFHNGEFSIFHKRVDLVNAGDAFEALSIPF